MTTSPHHVYKIIRQLLETSTFFYVFNIFSNLSKFIWFLSLSNWTRHVNLNIETVLGKEFGVWIQWMDLKPKEENICKENYLEFNL